MAAELPEASRSLRVRAFFQRRLRLVWLSNVADRMEDKMGAETKTLLVDARSIAFR